MSSYPEAPEGWTPVARRAVGPFTTHLTFRRPDGGTTLWSSRAHRKHGSRLSRVAPENERVWWAPERASWWIGVLFAVGSSCFLVAPFPGFVELVGSGVDGMVFLVGSVFFTSAATLQCLETFNADREAGGAGHRQRFACSPSSRGGSTGGAVCSSSSARCCSTWTPSGRCRRGSNSRRTTGWSGDPTPLDRRASSSRAISRTSRSAVAWRADRAAASSGGSQPSTLPDASPSGSRPLPPMSSPRQEA